MGCKICEKNYPDIFSMEGKKAIVKDYDNRTVDKEKLEETIKACPVNAIGYRE